MVRAFFFYEMLVFTACGLSRRVSVMGGASILFKMIGQPFVVLLVAKPNPKPNLPVM